MSDLMGKVIGVILSFIMLVFAPLLILGMTQDQVMYREINSEVRLFIDVVIDSGVMTDNQVKDLHLAMASYGVTLDTTIERHARTINPDGAGGTFTSWILQPSVHIWQKGDIIRVTVKAIDYTGGQKNLFRFLRFNQAKFEVTLAGMIRK